MADLTQLRLHQDARFPDVICEPAGGSLGECTPGFPDYEHSGIDIARRVVACWNACIGIPTEMLEATEPEHQPIIYAALVQQILELRGELKILQNREA